ncbi:MAG: hypothetical protein ABJG55_08825 [Paracoccaceae bacterium]
MHFATRPGVAQMACINIQGGLTRRTGGHFGRGKARILVISAIWAT